MLNALARRCLALSSRTGLSQWVAKSQWRRSRLLVLCYHGIAINDEHQWSPWLYISTRTFEHRLRLLHRNGCTVLPLHEAVERVARRDLPERAVVLTFDDGYYNFLVRAYPALRAFGYPATVYLTTLRCEHNYPIVNLLLSYALWLHRTEKLAGAGLPGLEDTDYPLETTAQRERVFTLLKAEAKRSRFSRLEHDAMAAAVLERLGEDYEWFVRSRRLTLMKPDEVAALSAHGVDFQLHTHTHTTPEDPAAFIEEVRKNRQSIREMTGSDPRHFCYPSGVYRMSYLPVLEAEGVLSATTCDPGFARPASNRLLLNRFVDGEAVSSTEFEAWLSGTAACWSSLRAACRFAPSM